MILSDLVSVDLHVVQGRKYEATNKDRTNSSVVIDLARKAC